MAVVAIVAALAAIKNKKAVALRAIVAALSK